ncbi:hypothetical protein acdb102_15390 [Acidothermaceae bacterium B102]|nr:hypothetical protein acdb102_15390 [Acidothermaceae bacterium B102]
MSLDSSTLDTLAIAAAAVAVIALVLAFIAVLKIGSLKRSLLVLQGDATHGSLLSAVDRHVGAVDDLRAEVRGIQGGLASVRGDLGVALRHVAVIRYDAFKDMGGRMSFSAALLDDQGDGLVITAINGRSETRAYAKGIKTGQSDNPLSPEETQAVGHALQGRKTAAKAKPAG